MDNLIEEEKRKIMEVKKKERQKDIKNFTNIIIYPLFILFILWLSILFSYTPYVWYLTRFLAIIAYILLFITTVVGILRKLGPKFVWTIKYHKPTAIWMLMFVIGHVISVIFDNYKYGFQLTFLSYFGLDYSSQWLWPTSIGAIAMWIYFLVVFSSIGKNVSRLGFKLWKKIHYLSYVGFILVTIHAFFIGTDFKTSTYSWLVRDIAWIMIIIVSILFIVRVIYGFKKK